MYIRITDMYYMRGTYCFLWAFRYPEFPGCRFFLSFFFTLWGSLWAPLGTQGGCSASCLYGPQGTP